MNSNKLGFAMRPFVVFLDAQRSDLLDPLFWVAKNSENWFYPSFSNF